MNNIVRKYARLNREIEMLKLAGVLDWFSSGTSGIGKGGQISDTGDVIEPSPAPAATPTTMDDNKLDVMYDEEIDNMGSQHYLPEYKIVFNHGEYHVVKVTKEIVFSSPNEAEAKAKMAGLYNWVQSSYKKKSFNKTAAFKEITLDDGGKYSMPVGLDRFHELFDVVNYGVRQIQKTISKGELYDLSNDELDEIDSNLNEIIQYAKHCKAVLKGKRYSGAMWKKEPEEFRADIEQQEHNKYYDDNQAKKSEAYYRLKHKLHKIAGMK